jgi:hypothetical protein
MKLIKIVPTIAILLIGVVYSCDSDMEFIEEAKANPINNIVQKPINTKLTSRDRDPVYLGSAGNFVILSKTGITSVYKSNVTGNVGTSPITGAALGLACDEVTGSMYTVNAAGPDCIIKDATRLTTAIYDMEIAYTDAEGRFTPDSVNLGVGSIGGHTLSPGLYKWTTDLEIITDITLLGNSDDVWIFQISGTLDVSSGVRIILEGAQAKNIFWQITEAVTLETTSHFEGNILCQTAINLKTGASINGRTLAHTEVTLQMNTVTGL